MIRVERRACLDLAGDHWRQFFKFFRTQSARSPYASCVWILVLNQLSFTGGKINAALPAGTYSCIAMQVWTCDLSFWLRPSCSIPFWMYHETGFKYLYMPHRPSWLRQRFLLEIDVPVWSLPSPTHKHGIPQLAIKWSLSTFDIRLVSSNNKVD